MRRTLPLSIACLLLVACVDTAGLSADSSKTPHPQTSANALVSVVEFADLECPACRTAHQTVNKAIIETYGNRITFSFKHFPLRSLHRYAYEAAQAAECAADEGKFWEFIDLAYEHQDQMSSSALRTWAAELGLDADRFDRCVKSGIKGDVVMADYVEGESLGVRGTPTYFVNGTATKAAELPAAIDAVLSQAGKNL